MKNIRESSVNEFINELASSSPAPGGGSASALVLSLSSALAAMVFNLTIGKKFYSGYTEEIKKEINDRLTETESLKDDFLKLMENDINVFNGVMAAYHLPKDTEEHQKIRKSEIQKSYINAMNNPLQIAGKALRIYTCCEIAAKYGNAAAISDAGVCALLADAAIESSVLNVKINLKYIENDEMKNDVEKEIKNILDQSKTSRESIMSIVEKRF